MSRRADAVSLAGLVLLGAGWGLHVVFTKALGAEGLQQAMALLVSYIAGTALGLVALAALGTRRYRPRGRHIRFFAVSSTLGYLGPILAELVIAPRIDAGLFALVAGMTPVATVALSVAIGRDRLTARLAAALAAGSIGAVVLLSPGVGTGPAVWVALAFLVPLFYGADNVYIEAAWPADLDSLQVSAGEGLTACAICAGLALALGIGPAQVVAEAVRGGWLLAGLIATSIGCVWLYFHLNRRTGGVFVSFASYVAIPAGVVGGVLAFGERPGAALAGAAAMLAVALWLLRADRAAQAAGA